MLNSELISTAQVAALLGCSTRTVETLAQRGALKRVVIGSRVVRFHREDVANYLRQCAAH